MNFIVSGKQKHKNMKATSTILLFFISSLIWGQDINIGIEISPNFDFQLFKDKTTKLRSSDSGIGFGTGLTLNVDLKEYTKFNSGLKFEFLSFDQSYNFNLVSSFRLLNLDLPLYISKNIGLAENWLYSYGGGVKYNLNSRRYSLGYWTNVNALTNKIQPYLSLGLHYNSSSSKSLQFGTILKYHVLDVWKKEQQNFNNSNTHLFIIDFSIKYFFLKS